MLRGVRVRRAQEVGAVCMCVLACERERGPVLFPCHPQQSWPFAERGPSDPDVTKTSAVAQGQNSNGGVAASPLCQHKDKHY